MINMIRSNSNRIIVDVNTLTLAEKDTK